MVERPRAPGLGAVLLERAQIGLCLARPARPVSVPQPERLRRTDGDGVRGGAGLEITGAVRTGLPAARAQCRRALGLPGAGDGSAAVLGAGAGLCRRGETATHDIFGDRAREEKILEVALAAGLGAAAGHLEAAERVPFDDGA